MSDMTILLKGFKGDIVTPSDPDYGESIARWATNAIRNAKIIAFVKDSQDVSLAVKFARASKLPLAIKGGGHSASGASSSEGGLVIDLSRHLRDVKVDAANKLAYVGGGAIWADVEKATIRHGLASVGGTVNHTGVGGLTLGGGLGWLSSAHGLVIDNLVGVTLVTADGSIRSVNSSENADLYWGVRGGGCNFGVVTEFVYKVHPQRSTVYAGHVIFPSSASKKLIALTEAWWTKGPSEKEAMMHLLTRAPDGNPCIIAILFYNGTETEGRVAYKDFFDIGHIADSTKEIPFEMLNTLQNDHVRHGQCTYMKGVRATKPRIEVAEKTLQAITQLSEKRPNMNLLCLFEYFPLAKICSIPNDATPFIRVSYGNVVNIIRWAANTEENLKFARAASREIADIILAGNVDLADADNIGYGNYDPEIAVGGIDGGPVDDKAHVLYGDNYPRLQALKQKYDPEMLFSKWFAITPA